MPNARTTMHRHIRLPMDKDMLTLAKFYTAMYCDDGDAADAADVVCHICKVANTDSTERCLLCRCTAHHRCCSKLRSTEEYTAVAEILKQLPEIDLVLPLIDDLRGRCCELCVSVLNDFC